LNLQRYKNLPWVECEFDCWGLVRLVYRQEFGIDLPVVSVQSGDLRAAKRAFKTNPVRQLFSIADQLVSGCVVELSRGEAPDHVGIYLMLGGEPWLLHNERGAGVCVTPWEEVLLDYTVIGSYQYDS